MIQIFSAGSKDIGFTPDWRLCARRLACKFDEYGTQGQGRDVAGTAKRREGNRT